MAKQKRILPITALAIASILWGLNTPLIKLGVASIPVPIFMSIRFLAASLIILPFALKSWKPLKRKDLMLLILSSLFFISLSALALNIGLTKTSALNSAVIWLLYPLFLFILSAEILKERMSLKTLLGIIVAFTGSLVIVGKVWEGDGNGLAGNLLVIIAVLCQVISILISKPLMKKVSTHQATFMSLFPGILPITIYALIQLPSWDVGSTSSSSLQALVWSTVFVTAANFLFYFALKYKKAQDTGVYQYIDTLAAFMGAWFLLSERPSSRFILGASLIFIGVYLAEFSKLSTAQLKRLRI